GPCGYGTVSRNWNSGSVGLVFGVSMSLRVAGSSTLELSDVTSDPLCSNANGVNNENVFNISIFGENILHDLIVPVGRKICEVVGDGIVWVWVVMAVEVLLVVLSSFLAYRGPWEIWRHGLHGTSFFVKLILKLMGFEFLDLKVFEILLLCHDLKQLIPSPFQVNSIPHVRSRHSFECVLTVVDKGVI
ncbi:hypothetical protein Tco_1115718, partial [Tanacetum coccineum]